MLPPRPAAEGLAALANKSAHKARVRARILDEAAAALRVSGTEGLSVAGLMQRAGLTHGGFYAHFTSRDDLVVHAIDRMFDDATWLVERFLPEGAGLGGLVELIEFYLSEAMLHDRERGCPLPWLSGEVPRLSAPARARFAQGIVTMRSALARALVEGGRSAAAAAADAASIQAEMVGAMALARALGDDAAALEHLAAAREAIRRRVLVQ